ncbi:hypothetical protein Esi_0167_0003 [Ectocarpus siliculosus]|uniref:Uncharacterized protein n=1 Tax=Ectocarpus siliculosus TaxID=2880 RepID=D8LGD6_ECTSI|nr:hypothetical protein Esi_0167_0003 [Ectocarpus siliculosus]|eukprot:CBN75711.1 hypothetical protein Esi_0167_0003 [Ectocarpus siliculosus]
MPSFPLPGSRAELLQRQASYAEAELLCQAVERKTLAPEHLHFGYDADTRPLLSMYLSSGFLTSTTSCLLQPNATFQGKYKEVDSLYVRAAAINEAALGPQHPRVAVDLNNQAGLLYRQGMYNEAEPLFKGSLAVFEKVCGPDHPEVATSLHNWARVLESQGKHNEAIPLLETAYSIRRTRMWKHHQYTTDTQTGLERVRQHVREQDSNY